MSNISARKHKIVFPPNVDREKLVKKFAVGYAGIYISRTLQRLSLELVSGMGVAIQSDKKALSDAIAYVRSLQMDMSLYMSSEEKASYDQKAGVIAKFCEIIHDADAEKLDYFIQILSDAVNADVVLACTAEEYEHLVSMQNEENPSAPTKAQWAYMRAALLKPDGNLESRMNALERHWYGGEPEPNYTQWSFSGEGYEGKITLTQAGYGVFISGKRTATYGPYLSMAKAKSVFGNFTKIKGAKWQGIDDSGAIPK